MPPKGFSGETLREWRRSRGWDVPALARHLRQAAVDDTLPVHDAFIRMIRRWEREGLRTERYELLYRSLGLDGTSQEAGYAPAVDGPQAWDVVGTLTRSSLSPAAVGIMEESVTAIAARYPYTAPADLVPDVQAMLAAVNSALAHAQPLQVRARCVRLAGILCGVAGQLADDTGRPDKSAGWFSAAAVAADETADPDLRAWTLALRAIGCHFRREYAQSARLLDEARDAAQTSAPRRQAWLAALSARAQAAAAAERNQAAALPEVLKTIGAARACLDAAGEPSRTDFFDGPRLAGMAGTALLMLRDTGGARELLAEALHTRAPGDVKGRALLSLDLAECLVADSEPEAAADLAATAIVMAASGGSIVRPVAVRAAAVHRVLRPWSGTRAVAELEGTLAEIGAAGMED